MEPNKTSDYPQELWYALEDYNHGLISRRKFLTRARNITVGGLTGMALLDSLSPNYAWGQQVPPDDNRITTEYATAPSPEGNGSIRGYLARPANAAGKLPGVIVIHGASSLNPHIEDIARRLATENFMAFAPDGATSVGGNAGGDTRSGEELLRQVDPAKLEEDFVAATNWLMSRNDCSGKVAVIGFCFGGGMTNTLAVRISNLSAAVPFYGGAPDAADVARIRAAVLVHHAELDERLLAGWPAYEAALKANNVNYEAHIYAQANHAFFNDSGRRYGEAAAQLAWGRTLDFLNRHLR
jgi:carboxymethylenebutenolidase